MIIFVILGLLSSKQVSAFLACLNPTIEFQTGNIGTVPIIDTILTSAFKAIADSVVREAVHLSREDWNSSEISWEFQTLPLLRDQQTTAPRSESRTLALSQAAADSDALARFLRSQATGGGKQPPLHRSLRPARRTLAEVPDDQISLYRPDREEDIRRCVLRHRLHDGPTAWTSRG